MADKNRASKEKINDLALNSGFWQMRRIGTITLLGWRPSEYVERTAYFMTTVTQGISRAFPVSPWFAWGGMRLPSSYISFFVKVLLLAAAFVLIAPAFAADKMSARQLSAEASRLYQKAAKTPNPAARLKLIEKSIANFNAIIHDYPESDLAKKILGGKKVGIISRSDLRQAYERTKIAKSRFNDNGLEIKKLCFASPSPSCLAEQAFETARGIENPTDHALALAMVAEAKAKANKISEAIEIVGYMAGTTDRAKSLFHIAMAQVRNGDLDGALESARSISRPIIFRVLTLGHIAAAQANADDLEGSQKTIDESLGLARGIGDIEERSRAMGALAGAEAKAKKLSREALRTYDESMENAREIKDMFRLALFFRDIAVEQAAAGFLDKSEKTFARAYDTSQGFIGFETLRDTILSDHAEALADSGDIAGAIKIANNIKGKSNTKALAMVIIAGAQARSGDIAGGLKTARSIGRSGVRAMGLSRIAAIQADAGDLAGARKTLAGAINFEPGGKKANALTMIAIAAAQFKVGDNTAAAMTTARLLKDARETKDEMSRTGYLTFIVRSQADAGNIKGAIETANSIKRPIFRTNALALIAINLADVEETMARP